MDMLCFLACFTGSVFVVLPLPETPVGFTVPLQDVTTAIEGDTVKLECDVSTAGLPDTWYKDDFEILHKDDDKYDVAVDDTKHALTIHDVVPEDQAEYTVEVAGERSSTVLLVEGVYRPKTALPS